MEKDVFKIVLGYLKYWYLFAIGAAICLVLAFFHIRYNTVPEYYVSGKVLLNDQEEGAGSGLESLSNMGLVKASKNIKDEIGILQSYDIIRETVSELGFEVGYYVEGRFGEVEQYEKYLPFKVVPVHNDSIFAYGTIGSISILDENSFKLDISYGDDNVDSETYSFDQIVKTETGVFKVEFVPENFNPNDNTPIIVRFRDIDAIATGYNNGIGVFTINEGGLLQIELTDAIPQRGIDVIDKLVTIYARRSAEHKNILSQSTLNLIDERLSLLISDLDSTERNVENFKRSQNLTNVGEDGARFIQLADATDREIEALRSQINSLRGLQSSLNSGNTFSAIVAYNVQNASINTLISEFNQKLLVRNNMVRASGVGNPLVQKLDTELQSSRSIIASSVNNIMADLNTSLNSLLYKSNQYKKKVSSVPTAERALLGINRDQGLNQNLYLFLLQKREEEALSISVPFSDTRVIEKPRATSYPVSPSKMPIYLGAILFGVFIPFIGLFTKEKLNTKITDANEIRQLIDIPILGEIATNKSKESIVVSENSRTPVAELFRLMRHNLKFLSQGKNNQVIMVTSSQKGEGKTFVSLNLAMSLAIIGKKVVALGFDLRAPQLTEQINLTYTQGLSDYIVSPEVTVDNIITPSGIEDHLHFIGSGPVPPNPGELMLNDRVGELIQHLRTTYDYIIIDTPPTGAVADAFAIAPLADATLFVTRQNYTPKAKLALLSDMVENKKLQHVMLVLNDVKMAKSDTYGGYGYSENKKKK